MALDGHDRKLVMSTEQMFVAGAVKSWNGVISRLSGIFEGASDDRLQREIAPGKNRVVYLLGHLVVAHDRMLALLNLGERRYEHLDQAYFDNPDRSHPDPVTTSELKAAWHDISDRLGTALQSLTPLQWLEKHSAVSDADFAAAPTRNRLAILLSRTNHAALHTGQIILTK
jgi:hypothetical protein